MANKKVEAENIVQACTTCRYSKLLLNQTGKPDLFCRRYPKQALLQLGVADDGKVKSVNTIIGHISVSAEDWCGEYVFSAERKLMPTVPTQGVTTQ